MSPLQSRSPCPPPSVSPILPFAYEIVVQLYTWQFLFLSQAFCRFEAAVKSGENYFLKFRLDAVKLLRAKEFH